MRYVIERNDSGGWIVAAYTPEGQLGAKIEVHSASEAMRVFLMLEGDIRLADPMSQTARDVA